MAADESERAGRGNAGLAVFLGASQEWGAYHPLMTAIAEEVDTLPEDKQ